MSAIIAGRLDAWIGPMTERTNPRKASRVFGRSELAKIYNF